MDFFKVSFFLVALSTTSAALLNTATNPFTYLENENYIYENHTITTEDGYNLLLVRLPYSKTSTTNSSGPPILFGHGIFCTFYDFINAGPGRAIALELLDEGYDVWLINNRGSTFSKTHVTLDRVENAAAYWNFSWHEVGIYDIPAAMDFITETTGYTNMSYVGHSQGCTIFLAMAAELKEYNDRINIAVLLGPVAYLKNAQQPIIKIVKNNMLQFETIVSLLGINEVLPYNPLIAELGQNFCNNESLLIGVCQSLFDLLAGTSGQHNHSLIAVLATNDPAGGSVKELKHYIQNANSDDFIKYDFGTSGNLAAYNQTIPPAYNLSAITAPVALFYGLNDLFVAPIDGAKLAANLGNTVANYVIPFAETNHLDVQWGTYAVDLVHRPVINFINNYN